MSNVFFCCCTVSAHPRGYKRSPRCPVLRGVNHCQYCFCAPCVIDLPPKFLKGSCDPHPANDEKRHRLYSLFWRMFSNLGMWRDEEYLQKKEGRTVRDDRRDIHPRCVIQVIYTCPASTLVESCIELLHVLCRKFAAATPVMMGSTGTTCQPLMHRHFSYS